MNELQFYTSSIPDSNPNKAELIKQWKIKNKWGQQEVKEVVEAPVKEVKTNGAAETDAAVVPTPGASESSDSGSGNLKSSLFGKSDFQKSYEKQDKLNKEYEKNKADYEAQMVRLNKVSKIDEIYSPGDGYNYRFSIDPESNTLKYEAKTVENEEFKVKTGIEAFNIANMLGHLTEEEKETLAKINAQDKAESDRQKKRQKELLEAEKSQLTAIPLTQAVDVERPYISFSDKSFNSLAQNILNSQKSNLVKGDKKVSGKDLLKYDPNSEDQSLAVPEIDFEITQDKVEDIVSGLNVPEEEKADMLAAYQLKKELNDMPIESGYNASIKARSKSLAILKKIKAIDAKYNDKDIIKGLIQDTFIDSQQQATPEAVSVFTKSFNAIRGSYGRGEKPKANKIVFEQVLNNSVKNDPFIKAQLLNLQINAESLIQEKAEELSKKYDTSTLEGNEKATKEYELYVKSLTQDKLFASESFKERYGQLQIVASTAMSQINLAEGRADDPFFSKIDALAKLPGFKLAAIGLEGLAKGSKNFQKAFNSIQLDFAADAGEYNTNMLSALNNALADGSVSDDEEFIVKGRKFSVKEMKKFFNDRKTGDTKNIVKQLEDLDSLDFDLSLYKNAQDKENSWLEKTFGTLVESAPMMGAAFAGSAATYLSGGTAASVIAPIASSLGSAALFTQFYGDQWYETFMQGARNEAKSKGINLDSLSKEDKTAFLIQALESGKYDKSAESAGSAALQAYSEKLGFSKQFAATGKALGLGVDGVGSLIKGQWKQTGKALFRGSLSKGEAYLSEFGTEWSQTVISGLSTATSLGRANAFEYVNFDEAWTAGKAGGSASLLFPGITSIAAQTRVEIQNLSRKIAVEFAPDSSFAQASKVADNFFKAAQTELDLRLKSGLNPDGTEYTAEQHQEDSSALASTSNAYRRIPSTASTELRTELLDLMVKRDKLQLEINKINDSDLTVLQQLELNFVKNEIKEVAKEASAPVGVKTDARALRKGASVAISQLGAGVERVSNTKDLLSSILSLEAQGIKVNINRNEKGEILPAKEQDYGIFAKVPDGKGGFDVQLIINDVSAKPMVFYQQISMSYYM